MIVIIFIVLLAAALLLLTKLKNFRVVEAKIPLGQPYFAIQLTPKARFRSIKLPQLLLYNG